MSHGADSRFRRIPANTPRGFGETAKEQNRQHLAGVKFPFTLFALALSEHELRNSFSHLAGAPVAT